MANDVGSFSAGRKVEVVSLKALKESCMIMLDLTARRTRGSALGEKGRLDFKLPRTNVWHVTFNTGKRSYFMESELKLLPGD